MNSLSLAISTPRFGACFNEQLQKITSCVLFPSDCGNGDGTSYLRPNDLAKMQETRCNDPFSVSIGRCTSSLDDNQCSATQSGCGIPVRYNNNDNVCNIVGDGDSLKSTLYPQCRFPKPDEGISPVRCVLSQDECLSGKEDFLQITRNWGDSCPCNLVDTGMCFLSSLSDITYDSSFCAVSVSDCPDSYDWMSSLDLRNMETRPRTCRLCGMEQTKSSVSDNNPYEHQIVESGGCYSSNNDEFVRCALESTVCSLSNNQEYFKSSAEMHDLGHVPCPADSIGTGKCTSTLDEVDCTNIPEACQFPAKFEPKDYCTVDSDTETGELTLFGRCRQRSTVTNNNWRVSRCIWQMSECDTLTEYWNQARKAASWVDSCQCEHVQTGACLYNDVYHCAVSEKGCADPVNYRTTLQLQAMGIDCRLCHPKLENAPETSRPTSVAHKNIIESRRETPAPTKLQVTTSAPVSRAPQLSPVSRDPQPTSQRVESSRYPTNPKFPSIPWAPTNTIENRPEESPTVDDTPDYLSATSTGLSENDDALYYTVFFVIVGVIGGVLGLLGCFYLMFPSVLQKTNINVDTDNSNNAQPVENDEAEEIIREVEMS